MLAAGDRTGYAAGPDRRRRRRHLATDNFWAGELIGNGPATMGDGAATAKIAMLDWSTPSPRWMCCAIRASCRALHRSGRPAKWGDETDPRIIGHEVTSGNEEGA